MLRACNGGTDCLGIDTASGLGLGSKRAQGGIIKCIESSKVLDTHSIRQHFLIDEPGAVAMVAWGMQVLVGGDQLTVAHAHGCPALYWP